VPSFVSRILGFTLKVVLGLFAALFAISLLVAGLIIFVVLLLKSLITGRRPAASMVFGRFQQFSSQNGWSGRGAREGESKPNSKPGTGDVVDVEVREVRDDQRRP
jgi:uncharacterized membrane protein YedE/YeeE